MRATSAILISIFAFIALAPSVLGQSCVNSDKIHLFFDSRGFPSSTGIVINENQSRMFYTFNSESEIEEKSERFRDLSTICLTGRNEAKGQSFQFSISSIGYSGYADIRKIGQFKAKYSYRAVSNDYKVTGSFSELFTKDTSKANFSDSKTLGNKWSECAKKHQLSFSIQGSLASLSSAPKSGTASVYLYNIRLDHSVKTNFRIRTCN